MILLNSNKNLLKSQPLWLALLIWLVYIILYLSSKLLPETLKISAYFPLIGEVGLDLLAIKLTYSLWKNNQDFSYKIILLLLMISFSASLMSDLVYNFVLNLYGFKYENPTLDTLFDIPFAVFLFFQLVVWGSLLLINVKKENDKINIFHITNIVLAGLLFTIFMFGIPWKIKYFSVVGIFQTIDTILEVCGFSLATMCLARSRSQLVRFLTIGYLIIISSDFIIRYSVVSGLIPYLSPFESTWILGMLMICIGCKSSLIIKNKDFFSLLPVNSLQSQITIWSLIIWLSSLLIFIISIYILPKGLHNNYSISPEFFALLVPFSIVIIISSNYLSTKISLTLTSLESAINNFIESDEINIVDLKNKLDEINETKYEKISKKKKFDLYEIEKLSKFILNYINELHAANVIKSEFLINMSHDFRTPASGIYHLSKSIHSKIQDKDLKDLLKLIVNSSEQLMNLLEDILNYSRLDNKNLKLNLQIFDINNIVGEVISFIYPKAKEKGLVISTKLSSFPVVFNGDKLLVHRVILSIISNAIKFTDSGYIKITTENKLIEKKKWIVLLIQDTGIGIDKSFHDLIFQPFCQVETSASSKYEGLGLGLSNVRLILNKMGGSVKLESRLNEGSTFEIYLPGCNSLIK
jgi:signal transduction histidine kinase